ncbi:PAS domain-containing protein [Streptomyces tropicalis]|uniref:PAS domain-containing protein n=1 Tax=Streptomyces tropicalis TaxID=3034234 RepID=A0ABT6AE62_9ACTN|nr:PAS domain-containing protein [Streptomyces tropicalis]MDF3302927.1 PAS domain-containing protein [Streptomyces tropicalis]
MSSRPSRGAARLAAILDALPDALLLVNANGTVVNANTIALEAFETPGTALVGRGLLDLLPEFDSKLIPGSMRRPDHIDPQGRTKPTRMVARRTDGSEFPVEVTSANLENGQQAYDGHGYTGDELLMMVVRDLSGTVDTEAELARSQRQTEMILRAASEGVVGTDTEGRIVLVNPAAAQILGYRAGELGGRELHTLVLHSRPDGSDFPYEESPLADTLRSGRKHRVRGQTLWSKGGDKVPVDLTTAPVRDGDQLVGAVMTFADRRPVDSLTAEKAAADQRHEEELEQLAEKHASALTALRQEHAAALEELAERHAEEVAAGEERYAALGEREKDRYEALTARHEQLLTLVGGSLRGPLDELRRELSALAADDAGQLWPEANQVLHHLSAGYARITTLIDNVLGYQRLDSGSEGITRTKVMLDAVVAAGVEGAVELVGPGRVQFAVHAPPIEAEVDPQRLATALAHLVADVAGVDATGNAPVSAGGYMDNTVVVAAAQRGEVVRIEVRGPYAGGDPVHEPIVRGIVRAHGGVLQTHEVPGMSGNAYVLEVPIGAGAGAAVPAAQAPAVAEPAAVAGTGAGAEIALAEPAGGGRRRARRGSTNAFLSGEGENDEAAGTAAPTGRRRRRAAEEAAQAADRSADTSGASGGTGRRRGTPAQDADVSEGAVVTAAEHAAGAAAVGSGLGAAVPPQGVPAPTGRRARRDTGAAPALPPALPAAAPQDADGGDEAQPTGRRRRALAAATERAAAQEAAPRTVFALPPAEADRQPVAPQEQAPAGTPDRTPARVQAHVPAQGGVPDASDESRHDAVPHDLADDHTPPQAHPTNAPTGRRRRAAAAPDQVRPAAPGRPGVPAQGVPPQGGPVPGAPVPAQVPPGGVRPGTVPARPGHPGTAPVMPGQPGAALAVPGQPGTPQPAAGRTGAPQAPAAGQGVAPQQPPTAPAPEQRPAPDGPVPPQGAPAQGGRPLPPQGAAPAGPQGPGAPAAARGPLPAEARPGTPASTPVPGAPQAPAPGAPQAWPAGPDATTGTAPVPQNGATGPVPQDGTTAPAAPRRPAAPVPPAAPPLPAAATPPEGTPAPGTPLPPEQSAGQPATRPGGGPANRAAQPLPAEAAAPADPSTTTQGHAISVRTLGQGVPFSRQAAQVQAPRPASATPPPHGPGGSGRRRKLGTRPDPAARPQAEQPVAQPSLAGQSRLAPATEGAGRSYAIGAPDENAAEGPEPLDGPGGAVEVSDTPRPQPMDDELPPEPLDNPRRLLVWPAPDVTTQQALSDRGYRPVVVNSREEVDAQIAAFPAALFVDPLTGPITRTALQSLRQAAAAAEVPVLVTAGLGQATREAAYGADPAVLLKALAPRDSEQHPPRVLLVEEHAEIALALTAALERRGMQVARAASDADAVTLAGQLRPNLVVMDLMQVQHRRSGIIDWLRANGQLTRTPLVVYTASVDQADLPLLASGETVLFLAERSTTDEVQARIVDLLARVGTN